MSENWNDYKAYIIEPVKYNEWAEAPVMPLKKADESIRLCGDGDYKATINPMLEVEQFPVPSPEDPFATLSGGAVFSKLDLASAYQQVVLEPESHKYLTISTHTGLFRYTRLPFGVASAPAIFQKSYNRAIRE